MRKIQAFITIEYTLLLPILTLLYVFLIYIGLYEYNASLLLADTYFLALEGEINYENKYLLAEHVQIDCIQKGNALNVVGRGSMRSPLAMMGIGAKDWQFQTSLDIQKHSATKVLRLLKEVEDGL